MKFIDFGRSVPALLTMVDDKGDISVEGTRKYINFLVNRGVSSFYVNGSTGEAFSLTTEDRKKVLEIIKAELPKDVCLIVQVGTNSTKDSLDLATHAEKIGADMISAIVPFYYSLSWDEIFDHYIQLMQSVELPFCPYYIPALSGVSLDLNKLGSLFRMNIKYLKYSSNDFFVLERLRQLYQDAVLFNGYDEMLLSGVCAGANSAIGSSFNFTNDIANDIFKAVEVGDINLARKLQSRINEFVQILLDVGLYQGLKYLLQKAGVHSGATISPMKSITDKNKIKIDDYINNNPNIIG